MTKEDFKELLVKLKACNDAVVWAEGKTWEEVYTTCHRGDWLLWLFKRTNPNDLQLLTLAKGHCANTVRYLMTDERSIAAVDAAIAFGEGKITREELKKAASYAARAAYNTSDAAYAAAYAARDAIASIAARAAIASITADAASIASDAAAIAAAAAIASDVAAIASAAAIAADAAAIAADAAADAAYADAAYTDDAAAYAAAKIANQKLTADIVRKYIKVTDFNIT